jgi:hypothetical protein
MKGTRELTRSSWGSYFDSFSDRMLNLPVTIELVSGSSAPQVEARHLALQALIYDRRTDVFEVAAARGAVPVRSVLRHMISNPTRITVDSPPGLAPMTIAIEDRDGVRTIVRLRFFADFSG